MPMVYASSWRSISLMASLRSLTSASIFSLKSISMSATVLAKYPLPSSTRANWSLRASICCCPPWTMAARICADSCRPSESFCTSPLSTPSSMASLMFSA